MSHALDEAGHPAAGTASQEILGVRCFPAPTEENGGTAGGPVLSWLYLPLAAEAKRLPDGSPAGQLIVAGETAFLQLSTVWDVTPERLEEIRRRLAEHEGVATPAVIRLSFAPVTVECVRLENGGEVAMRRSSGMAPHAALFSLPVAGAARDAAAAAFNGRTGMLRVVYEASAELPVPHRAVLAGDLAGIETAPALEEALREGRARLEIAAASGASAAAPDPSLRGAFVQHAVRLLRMLRPRQGGDSRIDLELVLRERIALSVAGDVGSWFASGEPPVRPVAGPGFGIAPPALPPATPPAPPSRHQAEDEE